MLIQKRDWVSSYLQYDSKLVSSHSQILHSGQREALKPACVLISHSSGPPSVPTLYCVDLSGDVSGGVNVTVGWTLSDGDSADFYLINITTNAPQTPHGGLLNITTASVTQHELTGFMTGYEYNITVRGVNCGSQEGRESEPLIITPQGGASERQCWVHVW